MPKVKDSADNEAALGKLGSAIRAHRHRVNMSQEALADAAKVNRTHMGEVERGKRNVSILVLFRIAQAMNVTPSEMLASAGL